MKKILLISFIISNLSFGQAITITPNNSSLFMAKSANNQPFTIKNDSIFFKNIVYIGGENIDQSSGTTTAASVLTTSIGQTFQAGADAKLVAIKLKTTYSNATIEFKLYKGTSATGILLATNNFNSVAGLIEYRLTNQPILQKDEIYFMEFNPSAYHLHCSVNNYLRGEMNLPSLANYDIIFETVVEKEFGVRINGNSGKIISTGGFEGDGSLLTNLKLVGDGSQITNLNVQAIVQEAIQIPVLQSNWVNHGGTFTNAGYWKDKEGLVHLQGLIKNGNTAISTLLFTLPQGYRPPSRQIFTVLSNNLVSRIDILSNGDVITASTVSSLWVNLTGIYFRVN